MKPTPAQRRVLEWLASGETLFRVNAWYHIGPRSERLYVSRGTVHAILRPSRQWIESLPGRPNEYALSAAGRSALGESDQ